jgi:hypothetical protein
MAKGGEALLMAAVPILAGGFLTFALYYVLKMVLKVTHSVLVPLTLRFLSPFTLCNVMCVCIYIFSAS